MKKFFFIGLFLTSINALAYNAEEIYSALDVVEVDLNPGIVGASRTEKAVGGLSCIRELIIVPDAIPTFDCAISKANSAEEIYSALDVVEVDLNPGIVGASRTEKAVGGLSCIRELIIVPNAVPAFDCTLN